MAEGESGPIARPVSKNLPMYDKPRAVEGEDGMKKTNSGTAYILWLLCMFGICGGQRFYTGNIVGGLLYLCTFGFFGIGQFLDLFFIPGMVDRRNVYLLGLAHRQGVEQVTLNLNAPQPPSVQTTSIQEQPKPLAPIHAILKAAKDNGGELSLAQATMLTELDPKAVKHLLHEAEKDGLTHIGNDPTTGAIRYYFDL